MSSTLRTAPIQDRSRARLQVIAAAARAVIQEKGRDRFTTDDVAKAAGCSIGTVYRYFPDRVAILDYLFPDRDAAAEALLDVRAILTGVDDPNDEARIQSAIERIDEWSSPKPESDDAD